jgi:TPR repeat protein
MRSLQASLSAMMEVVARAHFNEGTRQLASGQASEAARSFQRAISAGHAESHAALSFMHYGTYRGLSKSPSIIFELASAGASLGCIHSKGALADCLLHGTGTAVDVAEGFRLATESAAAGSLYGQHSLAVAYRRGVAGVPRDDATAAQLFTLAAEQGEVHSCAWLGNM